MSICSAVQEDCSPNISSRESACKFFRTNIRFVEFFIQLKVNPAIMNRRGSRSNCSICNYLWNVEFKAELGAIIMVKNWSERVFFQWIAYLPSHNSYLFQRVDSLVRSMEVKF